MRLKKQKHLHSLGPSLVECLHKRNSLVDAAIDGYLNARSHRNEFLLAHEVCFQSFADIIAVLRSNESSPPMSLISQEYKFSFMQHCKTYFAKRPEAVQEKKEEFEK